MADRPQPRNWDKDPHSPLTEDEWRAEFQRMDAQAARYGDLFETLIDDPNHDELIDREMGWDDDLTEDELAELDAECIEIVEDETIDDESDGVQIVEDGVDKTFEAEDEADEAIPGLAPLQSTAAWQKAQELSSTAILLTRDLPPSRQLFTHPDHAELFDTALGQILRSAALLRGGHAYGYGDQICGNIVKNRFALDSAHQVHQTFLELQAAGVLPATLQPLLPLLVEVQQLLDERIAVMRKRVWW